MKKYPIQLFEWNNENKTDYLHKFNFEFAFGKKKALKEVKEFIKEESIKIYDPVCPFFLQIYKEDDEDKKKNCLSINQDY